MEKAHQKETYFLYKDALTVNSKIASKQVDWYHYLHASFPSEYIWREEANHSKAVSHEQEGVN